MSVKARACIIPFFVPHLGCPNNCVFCNQNSITGQKYACSADTLKAEIELAKQIEYPSNVSRQIAFYGGSFTAIPFSKQKELLDTAQEYVNEGFINSIRFSTRPDAIDEKVIQFLAGYSIKTIELGAQSLDNRVLQLSGRGHTAEDVINSSKIIKDAGYELIIQMMTGLPGDTLNTSIDTARKICGIKPDGVRIYPTVIIENTPLYKLWKQGKYKEHTVEDAVEFCSKLVPVFENSNIPVIRLGLNPTDDLSAGGAVGGAYHPALCELVRGRIMYNKAEKLLDGVKAGSEVTIFVKPEKLSQMIGQHRINIEMLIEKFSLTALYIKANKSIEDEIRVEIKAPCE